MGQSSSHLSLPTTVPFLRNRQKPRMFAELNFTNELPLKLHKGIIKFDAHDGKGEQVQYGGRTPSQEREHLDQIEKEALAKALAAKKLDPKTTDYPRHSSEPETAKLLADIIADDIQLWDSLKGKANPAVSKGFPGASDIHIASMPGADTAVYNNVAFACLEEGISFGIVYEANWEELWFYVWKSRQIKADMDKATKGGGTPVYVAAQKNNKDCLDLLLRAKADANKAMNDGATPVFIAAKKNAGACLGLLLHAKADANKAVNDGASPVYIATQQNAIACLDLLLHAKANVDKAMNDGGTPVFKAAQKNHADCLKLLLHAKADVKKTWKGKSPVEQARTNGNMAFVKLLEDAEAGIGGQKE